MSKKIDEYKKKANRILKTLIVIPILIFVLGILISIINFTMRIQKSEQDNLENFEEIGFTTNIEKDSVYYENNININLNINNYKTESTYSIIVLVNEEKNLEERDCKEQNILTITTNDEGEKDIKIILYENDVEKYQETTKIYFVRPYKKQFLDELSNNGISAHFSKNMDNIKTLELLKKLGIRYIRDDIAWKDIEEQNGNMNFSKCDDWISNIYNSRYRIGSNFQ